MNRRQRRAQKKYERTSANRIVAGAGCLWQNDTADGLSFSMTFTGEHGNAFAADQHRLMLAIDADPRVTPERAFADLRALQKGRAWHRGAAVQQSDALPIFGIVNWLESRGHLRSDEHNGVFWVVACDGKIISLRHDPKKPHILERLLPDLFATIEIPANLELAGELLGWERPS